MGGSLRAREARRLFAAAADRLRQWGPAVAGCNQLYRGGGVRAWNELYAAGGGSSGGRGSGRSSGGGLVARADPRWREVGVGVRRPRLEDLQRVAGALLHGVLVEEADAGGAECE